MKKKIVLAPLSALLLLSVTACHQPDHHIHDINETSESIQESTSHSSEEATENATNPETSLPETSSPQTSNGKMSWAEYQEKLSCYVTNESSHNLENLISEGRSKITVEHEGYGSNTFHITTHGENSEYKTTISLKEGVRTPDIYSGFTSDKNGYIIIFHMQGYSVSPMDDIELACVLKTTDGGQTWNKTEYNDLAVSNGREYITAACFFTDDIGFFTARYYLTDHFAPRTYWTLDGGRTWTSMPELEIPNMLEPFGLSGFADEVSDVTVADGVYTLTVRICQGFSLELDGEPVYDLYIQFTSTDLINWTLKRP